MNDIKKIMLGPTLDIAVEVALDILKINKNRYRIENFTQGRSIKVELFNYADMIDFKQYIENDKHLYIKKEIKFKYYTRFEVRRNLEYPQHKFKSHVKKLVNKTY